MLEGCALNDAAFCRQSEEGEKDALHASRPPSKPGSWVGARVACNRNSVPQTSVADGYDSGNRGRPRALHQRLWTPDFGRDLLEQLGGLLRRFIGEHIEPDLKRQAEALTVMADPLPKMGYG